MRTIETVELGRSLVNRVRVISGLVSHVSCPVRVPYCHTQQDTLHYAQFSTLNNPAHLIQSTKSPLNVQKMYITKLSKSWRKERLCAGAGLSESMLVTPENQQAAGVWNLYWGSLQDRPLPSQAQDILLSCDCWLNVDDWGNTDQIGIGSWGQIMLDFVQWFAEQLGETRGFISCSINQFQKRCITYIRIANSIFVIVEHKRTDFSEQTASETTACTRNMFHYCPASNGINHEPLSTRAPSPFCVTALSAYWFYPPHVNAFPAKSSLRAAAQTVYAEMVTCLDTGKQQA